MSPIEIVNSLPGSLKGDNGFGSIGVSVIPHTFMAISIIEGNHKILIWYIMVVKARMRETSP